MVPNLSEMISTTAIVTRASAWVLEPLGADKRLDIQCGEA